MKDKLTAKKILVLGCPGSGKSTFAGRLRELTGLPLIHLDNVWWKADRTHISREEFDTALERILRGGEWILDGDYSRTYEVRLRACEAVVFLDYSEEVCMSGIVARVGKERADIPWTENTLDAELVQEVREYRSENVPRLRELFRKYSDKEILIFTSREEAGEWLRQQERPE